jgi:hypothetical protein
MPGVRSLLMTESSWARQVARSLLAEPLPRRWAHVQGVAATALSLTPVLGDNCDLVVAAAWLHDIGYSPTVVSTGFHPLDGARYLRTTLHASDMVCRLVAHHSCAISEADIRGLGATLRSEFRPPPWSLGNALAFCDMTTGPDGQRMTVEGRLADIRARYDPQDPVSRAINRTESQLTAAVGGVARKLASSESAERSPAAGTRR